MWVLFNDVILESFEENKLDIKPAQKFLRKFHGSFRRQFPLKLPILSPGNEITHDTLGDYKHYYFNKKFLIDNKISGN